LPFRRSRRVALLLSLLGCSATPNDVPESVIEVAPIRFLYPTTTSPPCAGTVPFLAQTAKNLATYLGLPLASRIDYHYRASLGSNCPAGAPACSVDTSGVPTVWTTYPTMPHELVHATVFPAYPIRLFAEGLAVALGGDDGNPDGGFYQTPISQFVVDDGVSLPPRLFYATVGDFSSFLVDRFGPSSFARLNPMVQRGATLDQVEAAFAGVYGEPLEQAVADRQASDASYAGDRLGFPECSVAPTPWANGQWSFATTMDCATNMISNSPYFPTAAIYATAEIPADGVYQISFAADGASTYSQSFHWQRCVSGEQFDFWTSNSPLATHLVIAGRAPVVLVALAAGRYFLDVTATTDHPADVSALVAPSNQASTDCTAPAAMLASTSDGIFVVPARNGSPLITSFAVPAARAAQPLFWQASLFLCDGSCALDGSGCQAVALSDRLTLQPGHVYTLVSLGGGLHGFAGLALP
jgi:hypothetical protein